jgi:NAD(P)-dependent dehydrogenase (short-subunit alcohol dehydrogenase family)
MKNIVFVGGSKGIGKEILKYLSKKHIIFNLSRSGSGVKNVKNLRCDISSYRSIKKVFKKIRKIDVLINNAGISNYSKNPITNFSKIIDVNLKGTFYCCHEAVSKLIKNKNSRIINIASINAHVAFPKNPGYISSKSGVVALTRSLALDYGRHGLNVNSISPGYINDGMAKKSYKNLKERKKRIDRMIINRFGEANDLFGVIDLLISNNSNYITGQDIVVDGGWLAKGF